VPPFNTKNVFISDKSVLRTSSIISFAANSLTSSCYLISIQSLKQFHICHSIFHFLIHIIRTQTTTIIQPLFYLRQAPFHFYPINSRPAIINAKHILRVFPIPFPIPIILTNYICHSVSISLNISLSPFSIIDLLGSLGVHFPLK